MHSKVNAMLGGHDVSVRAVGQGLSTEANVMGSQGVIRYIEKIVRLASSRLFLAQSQTKHVLYLSRSVGRNEALSKGCGSQIKSLPLSLDRYVKGGKYVIASTMMYLLLIIPKSPKPMYLPCSSLLSLI